MARRGDSLWSVTQRGAMPVWLLQQYNPDVDFAMLKPGTVIVLPRVVRRFLKAVSPARSRRGAPDPYNCRHGAVCPTCGRAVGRLRGRWPNRA